MKFKITIKDIVVSTFGSLISAAIIWGGGLLFSYLYNESTRSDISLYDLLTTPMPLWYFLVFMTILVLSYFVTRLFNKPPFLKEYEMNVRGLKRSWQWRYDKTTKRYFIFNLKTYCPRCGFILTCELYANLPYQCVNGHCFSSEEIGYDIILDNIVESLRMQYPKYRNIIDHT